MKTKALEWAISRGPMVSVKDWKPIDVGWSKWVICKSESVINVKDNI